MTIEIFKKLDDGERIYGQGQTYFSKDYTTSANINASSIAAERFINEEDEYGNGPFDAIMITNRDSVDLAVRLDYAPGNKIVVPSGFTIFKDGLAFRNFTIENLDASTAHTAGTVRVNVMNSKTPRKV
jgi:hypothetical protein